MACLVTTGKNKDLYEIKVVCNDGKRRTVRLGKVLRSQARSAKLMIERIVEHQRIGEDCPHAAKWLKGLSEKLFDRLENAGLTKMAGTPYQELVELTAEQLKHVNRAELKRNGIKPAECRQVIRDMAREEVNRIVSKVPSSKDWKIKLPPRDVYPDVPPPMMQLDLLSNDLPNCSGVYFLFDESDVCRYVGQSIELGSRVSMHHHAARHLNKISYLQFPVSELLYAEAYYIGILRPEFNFGAKQVKNAIQCGQTTAAPTFLQQKLLAAPAIVANKATDRFVPKLNSA